MLTRPAVIIDKPSLNYTRYWPIVGYALQASCVIMTVWFGLTRRKVFSNWVSAFPNLLRPWSWQKQVMHVMTIGYYWFAFAWLPNVLVAYVLYAFFHEGQYAAVTWRTCRTRSVWLCAGCH